MLVNEVHPSNAKNPKDSIPFPIVTLASAVQPWNGLFPILVTESGITMLVNPQPLNAEVPILVMVDGMVMLVKDGQFPKVSSRILVSPLPIVTLFNAEQPKNAKIPRLVTESGITMLVIPD